MQVTRGVARAGAFVVFGFALSVMPFYPEGKIVPPDPTSIADKRVMASIDDEDLSKLLKRVREPTWGGLWGLVLRMGEGRKIMEIRDASEGGVEVRTGRLRAPLVGRGQKFILRRDGEDWKISARTDWFT